MPGKKSSAADNQNATLTMRCFCTAVGLPARCYRTITERRFAVACPASPPQQRDIMSGPRPPGFDTLSLHLSDDLARTLKPAQKGG
jgi:hypothetical protein